MLLEFAKPEIFLATASVLIRAQIYDALVNGQLTPEAAETLYELGRQNPWKAKRALLAALSEPPPAWVAEVASPCLRDCEPTGDTQVYSGSFSKVFSASGGGCVWQESLAGTIEVVVTGKGTVSDPYKSLSQVERAFRSLKTTDLHIRPIHHRKAERVRAHVFLCMLSYYVEWNMRRALAPILFDDDDRPGAQARRNSPVAPARRSERAEAKAATKHTADGERVHSFKSLLRDLATIVKNRIQPSAPDAPAFDVTTRPTPLQRRALNLLNARLYP